MINPIYPIAHFAYALVMMLRYCSNVVLRGNMILHTFGLFMTISTNGGLTWSDTTVDSIYVETGYQACMFRH